MQHFAIDKEKKLFIIRLNTKKQQGVLIMQNEEITKQMIDCHKAAFENGFNAVIMLQEQTSKAMDNFLKQSPWIPVQSKSTINEWTNMCKKGTMDFKETADQNYAKLAEMLTGGLSAFQVKSKK